MRLKSLELEAKQRQQEELERKLEEQRERTEQSEGEPGIDVHTASLG